MPTFGVSSEKLAEFARILHGTLVPLVPRFSYSPPTVLFIQGKTRNKWYKWDKGNKWYKVFLEELEVLEASNL